MTKPDAARRVVVEAIRARVFPAAAIEVGNGASALWSEAVGTLTFDVSSPPANVNTPFDLASLTKVVATTTVVMELVRTGALDLDERVSAFFEDWLRFVGITDVHTVRFQRNLTGPSIEADRAAAHARAAELGATVFAPALAAA